MREGRARLGAAALQGATAYASSEPCAMCAGAMFWAGIGRIVHAAGTDAIGRILGGPALPLHTRDTLANARPAASVEGPWLSDEAELVLPDYAVLVEARRAKFP